MSSLQDCLSNCQKLSQCHQILSSKIVIKKLSSKIVIKKFSSKNCHQKLSPKIVIKNFHKSLGSPCSVVKTLIVSGNRATNQPRDGQWVLLSCSGAKNIMIFLFVMNISLLSAAYSRCVHCTYSICRFSHIYSHLIFVTTNTVYCKQIPD